MAPFNKLLKDISSQNWGTGCYESLATTQGRDCSYSCPRQGLAAQKMAFSLWGGWEPFDSPEV